VLVEDSDINTADDGVCLKGSTPGGVSRNVTVRRCTLRSRSSAVKYGSNCPILMEDHVFEDLYIHDSNRGLAIQARDGGTVQNIVFRRIVINGTRFWPFKWWGDGGAMYISSMTRTAQDPGTLVKNITFEDVTAWAENAVVLSGAAPGRAVEGVTLRRVNVTLTRLGNYSVSAVSGPSIECEWWWGVGGCVRARPECPPYYPSCDAGHSLTAHHTHAHTHPCRRPAPAGRALSAEPGGVDARDFC
jgi:hypothetical protein